jgi:hypothetical protein
MLICRLFVAAAICVLAGAPGGAAFAEQVKTTTITEAAVDKKCGADIEINCDGKKCASGCIKIEGGKPVEYGCVFADKVGKTPARCTKSAF